MNQKIKNVIDQVFDRRFGALMEYQEVSDNASFPYTRDDIKAIIKCQNNIIDAYYDTENIVPLSDSDLMMILAIRRALDVMHDSLNHPAFK